MVASDSLTKNLTQLVPFINAYVAKFVSPLQFSKDVSLVIISTFLIFEIQTLTYKVSKWEIV